MKKRISILLAAVFCLLLCVPMLATEAEAAPQDSCYYIWDEYGLLSDDELIMLEDRATELSAKHQFEIHVLILADYRYLGETAYEAARYYFEECDLGAGANRDGIVLLLSMNERDFAFCTHGYGEYAFTDYGQIALEESFLDELSNNDWTGGISAYLEECDVLLTYAEAGEPLSADNDPAIKGKGILVSVVLAVLIAFLITQVLRRQMKSVAQKAEAGEYIPNDGCQITVSEDFYTHSTETRTKIQKSSSQSHSGGGYSGRSGKF